jgi:hypothetical protein
VLVKGDKGEAATGPGSATPGAGRTACAVRPGGQVVSHHFS